MPTEPSFTYSTAPQPVKPGGRRKYREEDAHLTLMSDPRVVRGMVSSSLKKPQVFGKSREVTDKTLKPTSARTQREDEVEEPRIQPAFFFDVPAYVHPDIDLTPFLVEPEEAAPVAKTIQTQTDKFKDRPDTPEYVPRKTGVDQATQVEKLSDLFNFDEEVEPMVQVIVSKTLEQALFEIEREEELMNLQAEVERFHQEKHVEAQWAKKREQESIADACIKDLALKGLREKQAQEDQARTKVAARQAILQLLPSMVEDITSQLYEDGTWKDPTREHISNDFLPGIYSAAIERATLHERATEILDDLLFDANEAERDPPPKPAPPSANDSCPCGSTTLLKLILPKSKIDTEEDVEVGPISIHTHDSISSIENRIRDELAEYGIDVTTISLRGFIASAMGYSNTEDLDPNKPLDQVRLPQNLNIFV